MDSLDDYVFEEVIEEEYEDYDVTGKELLLPERSCTYR